MIIYFIDIGKEPMSASLPIRPGYPMLSTLDSLFSEDSASFVKLAAEASHHTDDEPHIFDFGVTMEESDNGLQAESRKKLASFMETDPDTVRMLMEREFAKSRERAARRTDRRKKPAIVKKLAEKLKARASAGTEQRSRSNSRSVDSDSTEKPVKPETTDIHHQPSDGTIVDAKSKARKTARDKFRHCENCSQEIMERIHLCAGCKKVAYCNNQCQKSHWKQHKKTCTYIQKSTDQEKVRCCGNCEQELSDRILFCAGCKKVPYCNTTCQRAHWKYHKKTCSYTKKEATEETS